MIGDDDDPDIPGFDEQVVGNVVAATYAIGVEPFAFPRIVVTRAP